MNNNKTNIPVLFENEDIIVADKPSGLLVHAYKKETNERMHLLRLLREQTGHYLYPIHRLDRPVSGIVLFGKTPGIVREIKSVWHSESTIKEYIALVKGELAETGSFSFPLLNEYREKQTAITHYYPELNFGETTLVKIRLQTGRKHQIRRHFSRRCANVIGDTKYGQGSINRFFKERYGLIRIFLHAHYFKITMPEAGGTIEINSPLPTDLQKIMDRLNKEKQIHDPFK
ncbi:hypothetical protein KJ966_05810 [bacterium]|nr:hypothetical protein [bacterium]